MSGEGVFVMTGFLGGDGTSDVLKVPYFSSVRWSTMAASSGMSTFHFLASTLMMLSVRRAHGQSSAISSSCFTPCVMSRLAVFSGRFSMWMVHAECTMYTAILQIWRRLYVFLYKRINLEMAPALAVQIRLGDT